MEEIKKLIEISRFYGQKKDFVIAGGGNTSFKNNKYIWVKASGTSLATIDENGFVCLDREKLKIIGNYKYSENPFEREKQVKKHLYEAIVDLDTGLRPSVETSLHDIIPYSFVVHTHPTLINGLLCARNSKNIVKEIFQDALYVEYTDPGYMLFKTVITKIENFQKEKGYSPKIIFLENHGVFVAADSIDEIKLIYDDIINKILERIKELPLIDSIEIDEKAKYILPALRMLLTKDKPVVLKIKNSKLIQYYASDLNSFHKISAPFTPDIIVYCKSKYLWSSATGSIENTIEHLKDQIIRFKKECNYLPKVILIKDIGLIVCEESNMAAQNVLDVFEDLMKISFYSENFGGPRFMTPEQINFIDTWEVENYRRKVSKGSDVSNIVSNKIIIITGSAQGIGEGIARNLFYKNANIVVADLNEEKGKALVDDLNKNKIKNKAIFVKTDISDPESIKNLIFQTVIEFGGLDVFISNAGVLKAGSLDDLSIEDFDFVTQINYKGFYLCVKYASEILKIQAKYNEDYYTDIIQINSKSGLRGSNKNFAYAGSKFGSIGLTQSFALELIPYRIKVNAICPGNYFEGPLWSDPKNGLFVQYLRAGKVPGARTIEDVRKYYEIQIPAGRGCKIEDIVKAICYVIDQQYETGQAIPVTGGQVMLN